MRDNGETYRGIGKAPFGYSIADDGVSLVEDPNEQTVIVTMCSLRGQGVSFRRIADRLNEDRIPARGKRWYPTTKSSKERG